MIIIIIKCATCNLCNSISRGSRNEILLKRYVSSSASASSGYHINLRALFDLIRDGAVVKIDHLLRPSIVAQHNSTGIDHQL